MQSLGGGDFPLMSRGDYGLPSGVAVSATLGSNKPRDFNRNLVASFSLGETQPRCG